MIFSGQKRINFSNVEKILIRSTNWIGDAVMTTPAVRGVRKNFPNARISILVKPWAAPVFENNPYLDEIIPYEGTGKTAIVSIGKMLKRRRFDAAILLQNAFEAALIAYLAKIPIRIGYNRDLRGALLTHPTASTNQVRRLHQTHYYNQILSDAGLKTDGSRLELYLSSSDRQAALGILKKIKMHKSGLIVGINPSATFGPAKQWLPERFAEVSNKLNRSFSSRTIIFGGPRDRELGRRMQKMLRHEAADLSGRTNLKEAMAVIAHCNLFITNDSGLMHVAAALNVPQIAIFGSTDHKTTGPRSERARIVRSAMDCSPCLTRRCRFGHTECMKQIQVERVYQTASRILEKKAES